MESNLMPLFKNPPGQRRVFPHPVTTEQERGADLPFRQPVQQFPGVPPGGTVVKSQSHIPLLLGINRACKTQAQ
jgi:hypothetical protein